MILNWENSKDDYFGNVRDRHDSNGFYHICDDKVSDDGSRIF